MNGKIFSVLLAIATVVLVLTVSSIAMASNGDPPTTAIPSSGDTTTGAAADMFGDTTHGQATYDASCAACHGPAGQPSGAFPGLADVRDPNPGNSIDPQLYDANPAIMARNIDPFLQHGSNPVGPPLPMPAFGDGGLMTQSQIADSEAYVMSLSLTTWPSLFLSGSLAIGSGFVPGATMQLYLDGAPFGSPLVVDSSGRISANLGARASQTGTLTANYAILNLMGVFANGDPMGSELGLDGTKGAALKVALLQLKPPAPSAVQAARLPSTGADLDLLAVIGLLSILGGASMLAWTIAGASSRRPED